MKAITKTDLRAYFDSIETKLKRVREVMDILGDKNKQLSQRLEMAKKKVH